jgi:hypothetical protein
MVAGAALLYSGPVFPFERRLAEGLFIPLAIFAAVTVASFWRRVASSSWARRLVHRTSLLALVGGLVLPTGIAFYYYLIRGAYTQKYAFGIQKREVAAFHFVRALYPATTRILCHQRIGDMVPWLADGRRPYAGHWVLTPDHLHRRDMIRLFFSERPREDDRMRFWREQRIDLLYYGPMEQALGPWNPFQAAWLTPVYHADGVALFALAPERPVPAPSTRQDG